MPPTEPAPYQPTVADIERRDDDARKRQAAYLEELRAVAQKARAEGRDRERERVERWIAQRVEPLIATATVRSAVKRDLQLFVTAIRTGKDPDR